MDGGIVLVVCVWCVSVWVCKSAVNIHSYSLATLVRASPVHSYGGGARGRILSGRVRPLLVYRASLRRWGALPPRYPRYTLYIYIIYTHLVYTHI